MGRKPLAPSIWLASRVAVAAVLSVVAAQLFGLQYPVYALIAAVVVTDRLPSKTRALGLRRMVGTVLGAALGAGLAQFLGGSPWVIGLAILIVIPACTVLRLEDAAVVAAYVAAIVVLEHAGSPWVYAGFRLLETSLGIVLAVATSYVFTALEGASSRATREE
jgi:uncharacterized membrane protein YgaE (UPF0421/DUF939 family)